MIKLEEPGGYVVWMSEKAYDDMIKKMIETITEEKKENENDDNSNAKASVPNESTNKTNETRRERRRNKRNSIRSRSGGYLPSMPKKIQRS